MTTNYPKYLYVEMVTAVYESLLAESMKFYEFDREGNRRYKNYRYHCAELYYSFVRSIAKEVERLAPEHMVAIFNQHIETGTQMMTTSADGGLVSVNGRARLRFGVSPGVEVKRLDATGGRDIWMVEFLSPVYENVFRER